MMVGLWPIHSLGVLPDKVSQQAHDGEVHRLEPKDRAGVQPGYYAVIFLGNVHHGRNQTVDGDEDVPDNHAAGNSQHMILGPIVGDQSRFAQNSKQNRAVEGRPPHPMACDFAVSLDEITVPEQL